MARSRYFFAAESYLQRAEGSFHLQRTAVTSHHTHSDNKPFYSQAGSASGVRAFSKVPTLVETFS